MRTQKRLRDLLKATNETLRLKAPQLKEIDKTPDHNTVTRAMLAYDVAYLRGRKYTLEWVLNIKEPEFIE